MQRSPEQIEFLLYAVSVGAAALVTIVLVGWAWG
jgi:hypothetical protein